MAGFPESVDIDSKVVLQYILTGLSTKQLEKMYTDLYRFIAVNGGTNFGMDWTTIHSQWPVTAEAMWRVHKELELRYIDPAKQR